MIHSATPQSTITTITAPELSFPSPSRPARAGRPSRPLEHPAHHELADHRDHEDAGDEADQAEVEPHVAVEDVAELVPDDALELVAREVVQRAPAHGDHGVAGRVAGGERVDGRLVVEHVHGRDRCARGDGHLLDDVEQPPLGQARAGRVDQPAAKHRGHGLAAVAQHHHLEQRPRRDDREDDPDGHPQPLPVEHGRVAPLVGPDHHQGRHRVDRRDDPHDRQHEQRDQPARLPPGVFLLVEEIHGHDLLCFGFPLCGTQRRSGLEMADSSCSTWRRRHSPRVFSHQPSVMSHQSWPYLGKTPG
jgi:hypothetical protein